MGYPLQRIDFGSWDQTLAATVADRRDQWDNACWTGTAGSMNTGHTGVGRCIEDPSAITRRIFIDNGIDANYTVLYVRTWVRFDANTGTQNFIMLLSGAPGSPTTHFQLKFVSGALQVLVDGIGYSGTTSAAALAAATWYDVELAVYVTTAASGAFEVRVNGVADENLTKSGLVTSDAAGSPTMVRWTNAAARIDDFDIKAGYDSFQSSDFMARTDGYPIVVTLYPNGDGAYTEWTASSGADYTTVDESQANTTDYVSSNVFQARESFTMDNLPSDARTIHSLKTVTYARGGNNNERMRHFLRLANELEVRHRGDNALMGTSWLFRDRPWPTNLRTDAAWAKSNIDGMQCMYQRSTGAATAIDISQVTAEVLYETLLPDAGEYDGANIHKRRTHRMVTCWKIHRNDGVDLRFTTSDKPLEVDGYTFSPVGGVDATAERREGEMRDRNKDFIGILSSDTITDDDLRAGRYRGALIEEFVCDWKYPWAGKYDETRYWIGNTSWTGDRWEAQVNGLTRWLKPRCGDVFSRSCNHTFGGKLCFYQIDGTMHPGVRVASVSSSSPRSVFTANTSDLGPGVPDDFFTNGKLIFRDGNNWGLIAHVRQYTASTREFKLAAPLPFIITTTQHFDAWEGCARTSDACTAKDNKINFGGFEYMPGTDKLLQTPDT